MVCAPLEGRGQKRQKIKLNRARRQRWINWKQGLVGAEKEIKMVSRFLTALKAMWKQGWFRTRDSKVEIEADKKKARIRDRTCREESAKASEGKYTRRREKLFVSSILCSLNSSILCSFNSFLSFIHFLSFFITGIAHFVVNDECIKRLIWVYWLLILEWDYFWLLSNRGLFYSVRVREACDRHFFPHGFEVEGVLGRARWLPGFRRPRKRNLEFLKAFGQGGREFENEILMFLRQRGLKKRSKKRGNVTRCNWFIF